jgi:hypothetical protein
MQYGQGLEYIPVSLFGIMARMIITFGGTMYLMYSINQWDVCTNCTFVSICPCTLQATVVFVSVVSLLTPDADELSLFL